VYPFPSFVKKGILCSIGGHVLKEREKKEKRKQRQRKILEVQ
jgi:hypothetical protein